MTRKQRTRQLPRARHARPAPRPAEGEPQAPAADASTADQPPPIGWDRRDTWIVAMAVLVALLFYVWRLNIPKTFVFDEVYHAFTAAEIVKGNADAWVWYTQPPPNVAYEWTHPALSKVLIQIGIRLFGDNAFGWRAISALFGALGIGLIYTMGRIMFNRLVGLLAAALLLLEGLWYVQSRIGMNDVFLATFIMAAYLGLFLYLRGPAERTRPYLWLTGAAIGAAFATKWSAGYSLGLIGLIVLLREGRLLLSGSLALEARVRRAVPAVLTLGGAFVVVPAAIYLAAYTQFFTMGHTWSEWRELQRQMWEYHSNLSATHPWASRWWSWPFMTTPVWYYVDRLQGEARPATIYALGNPLIFWAFLPAIGFAVYAWWQGRFRSMALAVVLLGFLGQWLPWMLSPRISFFYHMLPSVPFGCLAIAYGLSRIREPRVVTLGYLVPVAVVFIYFFPIYSAWPISQDYLQQHYWIARWQPR
ncbi:MAG: phospholipid carrier-dependent glycosyltransferase [Dehalococcoidia bacterium]